MEFKYYGMEFEFGVAEFEFRAARVKFFLAEFKCCGTGFEFYDAAGKFSTVIFSFRPDFLLRDRTTACIMKAGFAVPANKPPFRAGKTPRRTRKRKGDFAMNSTVPKAAQTAARLSFALLFGLFTLCAAVPKVSAQTLFPLPYSGGGDDSRDITFADVNGDGKLDLLILNHGDPNLPNSSTITVQFGNGDGTYQQRVTYACGAGAVSFALADINGDGKPDIIAPLSGAYNDVTLQSSGPGLYALLNKGDGTFGKPVLISTVARSVVVADVNGDGKPDLIVASGGVAVLIGKGDGTFNSAVFYNALASTLAVSDVNGDGKPDIATVSDGGVGVLLNKGDGTFGAATSYPGVYRPNSIAIADLNGDGKPDIVTAGADSFDYTHNPIGALTNGLVSIYRGNGDGTFQFRKDYVTGRGAYGIRVADLNADGKPDIVIQNRFGPYLGSYDATLYNGSGVSVLLNQGGGAFAQTDYETTTNVSAFTVADPRGVSKPDIFTLEGGVYGANPIVGRPPIYGGGGGFCPLLNKGDGAFIDRVVYPAAPGTAYISAAAVADVNGDGKPDLITLNEGSVNSGNGSVSVQFGNGSGAFGSMTNYSLVFYPFYSYDPGFLTVADVNGDGRPDLIVISPQTYAASPGGGSFSILLNQGNGNFGPPKVYPFNYTFNYIGSVTVADVNGDGQTDLIVTSALFTDAVSVLFNQGDGTYSAPVVTTFARNTDLHFADLNGDGIPDIVQAAEGSKTVSVLLGKPDGTYGVQTDYPVAGTLSSYYGNEIFLADVDGDGHLDILAGSSPPRSVLLGNGDGTFQARRNYSNAYLPYNALFADVNGDGKIDVVTTGSIQFGNGDGTFGAAQSFVGGYSPYTTAAVITDLNSDGRPDIVGIEGTSIAGSNQIILLYNQGTGGNTVSGTVAFEGIDSAALAQNVTFQFRPVGGGVVITKTASVLPSGLFHFDGIPAGAYNLRVKADKYLAVSVPVDASNGGVSGVTATLAAGDANNDNHCDVVDFGILINAYGSGINAPNSGYDFRADFNADGFVDALDFGLLVNSYGSVGTP